MDTWKNAFFLQENRQIPRFGGGDFGFWAGGGERRFFLNGRADFSELLVVRTVLVLDVFFCFFFFEQVSFCPESVSQMPL